MGIVADATGCAGSALISALPAERRRAAWGTLLEDARSAGPAKPEWLIDTLRDALPREVPVFTDACEMGYRMQAEWTSYGPRRFFYPSNYITLGWAFPAAVGAAVALGDRPVVSVSGDGGFRHDCAGAGDGRAIPAASHRHRPQRLDLRRDQEHPRAQSTRGDISTSSSTTPTFSSWRPPIGVPGRRARGPEELASAVCEALDRDGPSLIEVPDRWRFLRDLATPFR